jgi:thiol-disulfide isomerase/thioredoxin
MKLWNRFLSLLLVLLLAASAATALVSCEETPDTPPVDEEQPKGDEGGDAVGAIPGNNLGNLAYSADIPLLLEEGTFNPSKNRGMVTVINFWGTWCGPCKAELPHFEQLAGEYADRVTIFAVHSVSQSEDPVNYVNTLFPNASILFGRDASGDAFYNLYGCNGYYPYTIILDADGVITYRREGGLSYEQLKALVDQALAK